jgi:hypothetical protein
MFDAQVSFCSYIVGRRNRGKSHLLLKMLLNKKLLKDKFDEVILINPTYRYDEKYHVIKFTEVFEEFSIELLENLLIKFQENEEKSKILLILDDCISENEFKSNQSDHPLNRLAVNGRHWGVSLIILSQKYNAISSYIRAQLDYVILFETSNHYELKSIYEEYGNGSIKEFEELMKRVYIKKHDFLVIDSINNQMLKNFLPIDKE